MNVWRPHKKMFLDELLRHEGLGNEGQDPVCATCGVSPKHTEVGEPRPRLFRCDLCAPFLECADCCVKRHTTSPLHWIKVSSER